MLTLVLLLPVTCSACDTKAQPDCLYRSTTVCEQAVHCRKACPVRHICVKPLSWPRIMWGTGPRGNSSWSTCSPATAAGALMPKGCCSVQAISSTATAPASQNPHSELNTCLFWDHAHQLDNHCSCISTQKRSSRLRSETCLLWAHVTTLD